METINLVQLIRESKDAFLRRLPLGVIYLLKWVIKERSINQLLLKFKNKEGLEFLACVIDELKIRVEIEGLHNLPADGRCVFVSNHPFGIADGLILAHTISKKYGEIKAIGNDAFLLLKPLHPFIFSVNVYGKNTKDKILKLDDLYASSFPITHFPAGEVSRCYNGVIQDREWQKSYISKAVQHQRDIVPIFFEGTNSRSFYFTHWLRRKMGISTNLELALLPREVFKKRGKTIRLFIGEPISYKIFNTDKTKTDWCSMVRNYTYDLGKGIQNPWKKILIPAK